MDQSLHPRSQPDYSAAQLADMLERLCHGELTAAEGELLEHWVVSHADARRVYVQYLHMHALLPQVTGVDPRDPQIPASASPAPAARGPLLGYLADSLDRISQGHLTPRMLVIGTAVALSTYFAGLLIMVGFEQAWARRGPAVGDIVNPLAADQRGTNRIVAHLTEVAGCRWQTDDAIQPAAAVGAGQSLQLIEGVAELRFSTGVNVVVEGPCMLRFESSRRLAMSRGKLLARVPRGAEGFTVATPSVDVIDLGTEFGVDVAESGAVEVTVLQGRVNVQQPPAAGQPAVAPVRLLAGQSTHVGAGQTVVVPQPTAESQLVRFARILPGSTAAVSGPPRVLLHYRLGEDDPTAAEPAESGPARARTYATTLDVKPLQGTAELRYTDDVRAPGSRRAVSLGGDAARWLTGPGPVHAPTDDWVLEAWVRPATADGTQHIALVGNSSAAGYGLLCYGGTWQGLYSGLGFVDSGVKCRVGQWTHLALVCERGQSTFYVDGQIAGPVKFAKPRSPADAFSIGATDDGDETFAGEIDEVRLFELRGGFRPEMLLR